MEFSFARVTEADFDELVALRIATMRASLERIGRLYQRHRFVKSSEDEWDIANERPRYLAAG
ncbi:MAG: hypothetical protein V4750_13165 [Pseudomonadota bacterium]